MGKVILCFIASVAEVLLALEASQLAYGGLISSQKIRKKMKKNGDVSKLLIVVSRDKFPDNLIMNVY